MSTANDPQPSNLEPSGDSALYAARRSRMVETQLKTRGLTDERVLQAMRVVPRELFVPVSLRDSAYDDCALPIGHGQTISQPFTVAFMCEALRLQASDRVLEIGTGSGYGAAVLSQLAQTVHTVERIPELAQQAEKCLQELGYKNVFVHVADGSLGLAEEGPFQAIIVTAGAARLPQAYLDQLAEGGRIVIPLGSSPYSQSMFRFTKHGGELTAEELGGFAFVPLVGVQGWQEPDLTSDAW